MKGVRKQWIILCCVGLLFTAIEARAQVVTSSIDKQLPFSFDSNILNARPMTHVQGEFAYARVDKLHDVLIGIGSGEAVLARSTTGRFSLSGIGSAGYATAEHVDGVLATGGGKLSADLLDDRRLAVAAGLEVGVSSFGQNTDTAAIFFASGRFTIFDGLATYATIITSTEKQVQDSVLHLGGVFDLGNGIGGGLEVEAVNTSPLSSGSAVTPFLRAMLTNSLQIGAGLTFGAHVDVLAEGEITYFF